MHRLRLRAGALVATLAAAVLIAPPLPAHADTVPDTQYTPVSVADMNSPNLTLTQADDGVTVGCAGGSTSTRRINASGTTTHSIPNAAPYPSTCPRNAVVTADGTLVTLATSSNGWPLVQDIKDGSTVWSYTGFPCFVAVRDMVAGTDGNVYILYTTLTCGGQSYLLGLTPGGTSAAVVMNNVSVSSSVIDGGLAATTSGLTLRTSTGLQFVSYSGSVSSPTTITGMVNGIYQYHADATLSGRTLVPMTVSTGQQQLCGNDSQTSGGVYEFNANGQIWGYNSLPACSHVYEFYMTPSGGAVIHYDAPQGGIVGNPRVQYLLGLGADGSQLWTHNLTPEQSVVSAGVTFAVDLNGNVAVQQRIRYVVNANGSQYPFPALRLQLLDELTGGQIGSTYELSGDHSSSNGNGYDQYGTASLAIGHGTWYVLAMNCYVVNSCDTSSAKLYAIKVAGLQMDYPRGAILSPVTPKNYAALGDSFSSAEGVEPFVSPSNTDGCHRGANAYAQQLNGPTVTGWHLTTTTNNRSSFVACSGASISDVTTGRNGESPQTEVLNSSTDVITISIGGNNVPFQSFVIDCLFRDCSDSAVNQSYFANISGIGTALTTLYTGAHGIHDKAANAHVYAMGYPQLLPTQGCSQTDGWMQAFGSLVASAHGGDAIAIDTVVAIGHLGGIPDSDIYSVISAGVFEFNTNEVATARSLVVQLDGAIQSTVASINQPWLTYVDPLATGSPFLGHELCTNQPYFNGLDGAHNEYSYHPNELGQGAYKQLLLQLF